MTLTKEERNKIVLENQGLIWHVINSKHYYALGESEDLYQEGMLGLINAVENYDESQETKFSTYAVKAIQRHINRYISENKMIRIPQNTMIENYQIEEYVKEHPDVEDSELENKFGISAFYRYKDSLFSVISGDAPISAEEGSSDSLMDFVEDKEQNVEKKVIKDKIREDVQKFYKSLDLGDQEKQRLAEDIFFEGKRPKGWTDSQVTKLKKWYIKKLRSRKNIFEFYQHLGISGFLWRKEIPDYVFGTEYEDYK